MGHSHLSMDRAARALSMRALVLPIDHDYALKMDLAHQFKAYLAKNIKSGGSLTIVLIVYTGVKNIIKYHAAQCHIDLSQMLIQ
jgi:glutamate/tyrosine decarboxylase-like PLP-dependent enzyme